MIKSCQGDIIPVYVVDIIGECVPLSCLYTYGRQIQILEQLQTKNNNVQERYPLIALYQDFPEKRGEGYYATVIIQKILIACLTTSTDFPPVRYTKTFKPILYPIYYEFLQNLANHINIAEMDAASLTHIKWDRVGSQPTGQGQNEYIDAIEINNLTLTIVQNITK